MWLKPCQSQAIRPEPVSLETVEPIKLELQRDPQVPVNGAAMHLHTEYLGYISIGKLNTLDHKLSDSLGRLPHLWPQYVPISCGLQSPLHGHGPKP